MADAPRPASEELAELVSRQERLAARVGEVEAKQRAAVEAARRAAAALVALERAAAGGERVTAAQRREAEDTLLQARTTASAPWSERLQAARLATQDAAGAVTTYARENVDELLAELAVEGERAAQAQDAAAEAVVAAFRQRASVEQRTFQLLTTALGQTRPSDVRRSRGDALAAAAERLLSEGGEVAPVVVSRPGERHVTIAATMPAP